jgi:hypothetical protein
VRVHAQGQAQSRPAGGACQSERPLIKAGCNDVAVDRLHQACHFLASLGFPGPLRHWLCGSLESRWHTFGTPPEVRGDLRKARLFIRARISF